MADKNTDGFVPIKVKNVTVMVNPSVTDDLEFLELLQEGKEHTLSNLTFNSKFFTSKHPREPSSSND